MQIRCFRCNHSFAVKREELQFALEAVLESGGTHYDARCPRCRRNTPISLEQLKRVAPRDTDTKEEKESSTE
jgi:hypothetical protein